MLSCGVGEHPARGDTVSLGHHMLASQNARRYAGLAGIVAVLQICKTGICPIVKRGGAEKMTYQEYEGKLYRLDALLLSYPFDKEKREEVKAMKQRFLDNAVVENAPAWYGQKRS